MPKITHIALSIQHPEKPAGFYVGPDGVLVDVSETGWVGASGFRPQ